MLREAGGSTRDVHDDAGAAVIDAPPTWRARLVPAAMWRPLMKALILLAAPLVLENLLHIGVGLTDTYLANRLDTAAAAAIGPVTYVTWFLGLTTGAVGTGSTALISRATGARDRRTARSAVGQSILLAVALGAVLGVALFTLADPLSKLFGLSDPKAQAHIATYLRILGLGVPLATSTFIGNACLRGAGDTITPALAMVVIDVVNIALSFALCFGFGPIPAMGFAGIAWGTSIAYGGGAFVVVGALLLGAGKSGLRLYPHRLRPAWKTTRRILKVGLPSGFEGVTFWGANFVVLHAVNTLGNAPAAAHNIVVRVEAFSYMTGFAIATAAATMVGQSLGMRDPDRARLSGTLAFVLGGGVMVACGAVFVLFPGPLCGLIGGDPRTIDKAADALRVVGFAQVGFAAMMIYGGALRGAGDTTAVMVRNLGAAFAVRMTGAILAVHVFGLGLTAVWCVLGIDLMVRGALLAARFYQGKWTEAEV